MGIGLLIRCPEHQSLNHCLASRCSSAAHHSFLSPCCCSLLSPSLCPSLSPLMGVVMAVTGLGTGEVCGETGCHRSLGSLCGSVRPGQPRPPPQPGWAGWLVECTQLYWETGLVSGPMNRIHTWSVVSVLSSAILLSGHLTDWRLWFYSTTHNIGVMVLTILNATYTVERQCYDSDSL